MNSGGHAQLEDLLDQQISSARNLAALLEQERAALIGQSPAAVAEKAAQKIALLARLERLETERRRLFVAAGVPASAAPIDAAGNVHRSMTASIATRWQSLLDLLKGCRSANDTNGLIVNLRQGQIRQLLAIIRGVPSATYGPRGLSVSTAARPLARA